MPTTRARASNGPPAAPRWSAVAQISGAKAPDADTPLRALARAPLDTTSVVETPEQVRFTLHVAGPVLRAGAYLLDSLVRGLVLLGLSALAMLADLLSPNDLTGFGSGAMLIVAFLVEWAYFVLTEATMGGQSPGKRALGLRVVAEDGRPLSWSQSILRNLLRAADFLPMGYALGVISMVFDKRFKRLGDHLAATLVVIDRPAVWPQTTPQSIHPAQTSPELDRHRWSELEHLLRAPTPLHARSPLSISRVAALYRASCSDLMRVRARHAGHPQLDALDALVARGHHALYAPAPFSLINSISVFTRRFPATVRANLPALGVSAAFFLVPLTFAWSATLSDPDFALRVLPASSLEQLAQVYRAGFEGRSLGTDTMMAGFYVYNNVSIAFRCFATGILFGAGSIFFLLYNGLLIGTVFGFVTRAGAGAQLGEFVVSHAPLELTAIIICGAAGLRMGYSLIDTQGHTRWASLKRSAPQLVVLVLGAAAMLWLAAAIEAYWSASPVPGALKYVAGSLVSLGLLTYFTCSGRGASRGGAV